MPYNAYIGYIGEMTPLTNTLFINDNPCNFLTQDNEVYICDDIGYDGLYVANTPFAQLSDSKLFPDVIMFVPIIVNTAYGNYNDICIINTDGELYINNSFYSPIFYTNGISFSVNNKYYNKQLGNIYGNFTSPVY